MTAETSRRSRRDRRLLLDHRRDDQDVVRRQVLRPRVGEIDAAEPLSGTPAAGRATSSRAVVLCVNSYERREQEPLHRATLPVLPKRASGAPQLDAARSSSARGASRRHATLADRDLPHRVRHAIGHLADVNPSGKIIREVEERRRCRHRLGGAPSPPAGEPAPGERAAATTATAPTSARPPLIAPAPASPAGGGLRRGRPRARATAGLLRERGREPLVQHLHGDGEAPRSCLHERLGRTGLLAVLAAQRQRQADDTSSASCSVDQVHDLPEPGLRGCPIHDGHRAVPGCPSRPTPRRRCGGAEVQRENPHGRASQTS